MELRGLGIDLAEHRRQTVAWSAELTDARREYQALTGDAPPSKPAEVQAWLVRVLDADTLANWPRTASGQPSIKDTHLKRLIHIPSCRPVLAMLATAKLISTFGPKLAQMVNPVTGRLHASFNIAGTKAGRFSCTKPNLQQLPSAKAPDFKRCIRACTRQSACWLRLVTGRAARCCLDFRGHRTDPALRRRTGPSH